MKILIRILSIASVAGFVEATIMTIKQDIPMVGMVWALAAVCAFLAHDLYVTEKKKDERDHRGKKARDKRKR